jgi:hypothetical protein
MPKDHRDRGVNAAPSSVRNGPNPVRRTPHRPKGQSPFSELERRTAQRSTALEFRSWLGWWDDDNFIAVACRLLDISRGGVAMESEEIPPADQNVWFCLHPGEEADCMEGEVVAAEPGIRGRHRLRIAFFQPCSNRVLDLALRGSWNLAQVSISAV